MGEESKGFGEQLFARLQGKGLSRAQIYKALALQRLNEEVMELGAKGLLSEQAMLEISKISSAARQKQLAEVSVERGLNNVWIKELARLIRSAEKAANDKEGNKYWDFFFEVKDLLEREGSTKQLLDRVRNFSVDKVSAEFEGASDRQVVDFKKYDLELGRGLDVGTSNIVASARCTDGTTLFNIQRNAFLDVRSDTFTKKMLMKLGVDHIVQGDKGYVIGDPAFELANIFEKNTRRPMKDGMISPVETEALLIVSLIIAQLLGHPKQQGEICAFSVPADPVDAERNVIYHRGALEQVLRKLGYTPKPMLEGHSVVFGELASETYTGIGISAGAGMFNVCIAYKSVPALVFATSRGGDWIDNNVSTALGIPSSQVCAIKESGVDLVRPRDRVEEAICIYYRNLIQYTLEAIRDKFESASNMPNFSEPFSIVCAGGTSMIKGFIDVFREEYSKVNLPLEVKEIRMARDPLRTVAAGCLAAAQEETHALTEAPLASGTVFNMGRSENITVSKIDADKIGTKRRTKPEEPKLDKPPSSSMAPPTPGSRPEAVSVTTMPKVAPSPAPKPAATPKPAPPPAPKVVEPEPRSKDEVDLVEFSEDMPESDGKPDEIAPDDDGDDEPRDIPLIG